MTLDRMELREALKVFFRALNKAEQCELGVYYKMSILRRFCILCYRQGVIYGNSTDRDKMRLEIEKVKIRFFLNNNANKSMSDFVDKQ